MVSIGCCTLLIVALQYKTVCASFAQMSEWTTLLPTFDAILFKHSGSSLASNVTLLVFGALQAKVNCRGRLFLESKVFALNLTLKG